MNGWMVRVYRCHWRHKGSWLAKQMKLVSPDLCNLLLLWLVSCGIKGLQSYVWDLTNANVPSPRFFLIGEEKK